LSFVIFVYYVENESLNLAIFAMFSIRSYVHCRQEVLENALVAGKLSEKLGDWRINN